jgi:hypothetical protein
MLKNLKVKDKTGERLVGCVVLKETEKAYVFIRLNSIMRADYDQIMKIMRETDKELLEAMRDTRLTNGMLALNVYKDVIETVMKEQVNSDTIPLIEAEAAKQTLQNTSKQQPTSAKATSTKKPTTATPQKRKPGRPRKNPQ